MEGQPPGPSGKSSFFKKPSPGPPLPTAGQSAAPSRPPAAQRPTAPPPPSPPPPSAPPPLPPPLPPPAIPGRRQPELPGESVVRRPSFHGAGGTLFGMHIVNVLLTLVTLGVYYFWAKTKVRRFLWSQTQFEGDRFAYHGTGRELLLGFAKALLVFGVPIGALSYGPDVLGAPDPVRWLAGVAVYILLMVFTPVALVGSRRYRLSRTSWRAIRFSFRGRVWDLIKIFISGSLWVGLTFGLYYPFFLTQRQAFMISNSYFGNERFDFNGRGRDLFGSYVLAILLTLPTLALCWFWYVARKRRYFWDHTLFGAARFHSTVTGGALLRLHAVNVLLLVVTLGLAWPWVKVRNIEFAFRYLVLTGPLDVARIQQQAQYASPMGEGLAGFLDTGFDLG